MSDFSSSGATIWSPLGRIYRDVRAGIIHPVAGMNPAVPGKLAFRIAFDTMLRWA